MPAKSTINWNAYPGPLAAAWFSIGVVVAEQFHPPFSFWAALGGVSFCAACIVVARRGRVVGTADTILTFLALFAALSAGGIRQTSFESVGSDHIARFGFDKDVEVVGRIAGGLVGSGGSLRFILRLDPELGNTTGLLQVAVRDPRVPAALCDVVRIRGRLTALPHARNPGDFDYGQYLRRKRIFVRLFAGGEDLQVVGRAGNGVACSAQGVRSGIARRVDLYVASPEARGIVKALLLGDRSGLDPTIESRFARTGLLHLLAVSGLHVMVVGMILYRLLRPSLMRLGLGWHTVEAIRGVLTTVLLLSYMILTGGSASVVRAVVMALLFMAAAPMQRTTNSLNTLGVAALILLALRPAHLFEPGFQLSTAAVAGLIVITPQLSTWVPAPSSRPGRYVHSASTVTIAATLGTLPIILAHFGQVALAGLLLNLPAVPLTTAALSAGIAAVAAGEFTASLGTAFGATTDILARLILLTAELGDKYLGWSLVRWNVDHPSTIIALGLIVAAVARWKHPHHRWPLLIAVLAVMTVHAGVQIATREWSPHVEILFLDVGQGDAAIIRLPNGRTLVVDAGPRSYAADAGERIILPQLERLGIERIHTVVITHPDSDHLGGLPALLRSIPVGRVVRSGFQHTSDLYQETNYLLDSLHIPTLNAGAGDTLEIDPNVRLYVLHPDPLLDYDEPNANSIVLLLRFGETSVLLTGDAPVDAERSMAHAFGDLLEADVLKVGHHGSRTSSSAAFLSEVKGEGIPLGVVSVAERNRFGLPDEDVMARLELFDFRIHTTARAGALWVRLDRHRVRTIDW